MFGLLLCNSGNYEVKSIRYKHGGRLVARNSNKKCLLEVANNLNSGKPKIILKKMYIVSLRNENNVPIKRLKKYTGSRKNMKYNFYCPNNRNNEEVNANIEENSNNENKYNEVTKFKKCLNYNPNDCNKLNKYDAIKNGIDNKQNVKEIYTMCNNKIVDIQNTEEIHTMCNDSVNYKQNTGEIDIMKDKNDYDEFRVFNTDIRKNTDIDNEQDSNKNNDSTFNDTDMSDFCNRRNYFSHSTCICNSSSYSDKNATMNNIYNKNNIDISLCDTCGLNKTYSINKTPDILDRTIDPNYIENSVDYNKNANKNMNLCENNKSAENFNTTTDNDNENLDYSSLECNNDLNQSSLECNNDLNQSSLECVNNDMHENLTNSCDKNDITDHNSIRDNTYIINNNEHANERDIPTNIYTNFGSNIDLITDDIEDSNCNNINIDSEYESNDSDYNPISNSDITTSNTEIESDEQNKSDNTNNKNKMVHSTNTSIVSVRGCNDENMYVSDSIPKGAQKKNFCFFCKKFQSKIARHLEKVHYNEKEVQAFSVLSKGTLERKKIIETLRRNGNFLFNTDPILNTGELIVCRRPRKKLKRTANDFTCCIKCKGFFTKNNIRHHFAQCSGKKGFRAVQVLGRKITGRIHNKASKILKNVIFPVLRDDSVTRSIKYDQLLVTYGNKLAIKYRHVHQHDMIRSRLRLLGRFWLTMKKFNEGLEQFSSIYDPQYYDDCIKSVNEVAQLDKDTNIYKSPATASSLGTLLKQVGNFFITECIKTHDYKRKENAENFLKILQEDYTTSVNKVVEETQSQNRRQKKVVLPSIDDIKKLYHYLHQKRKAACDQLKQAFTYQAWLNLAQSTLILLQLFNRRRAGEIERVLIEDFKSYKSINKDTHKELYHSLSSDGQKLVKKYVVFAIRGKLMRTVPVILHSQLLECLQIILKYRDNAKVPSENPFLFGVPNDNKKRFKYLRACVLLRKFSEECGAKLPYSLRGTQLRKHIATCCITLNLSEDQVTDLANFMGHDKNIHKSHYRQPIPELEIIRITQLLKTAQGGAAEDNEDFNDSDYSGDNMDINNSDNESDSENVEKNVDNMSFQELRNVKAKVPKKDTSVKMKKRRSTSPYGRTKRRRWTVDERDAIYNEFKSYLLKSRLPPKSVILHAQSKNTTLNNRSAAQIRTWMHNQISGKTKKHTL